MLRHALSLAAAGLAAWTTLAVNPAPQLAGFTRLALLVVFFLPLLNATSRILKGPPPI